MGFHAVHPVAVHKVSICWRHMPMVELNQIVLSKVNIKQLLQGCVF